MDCTGNLFPETGPTGFRAPSAGNWGFLLTNIQSFDGFIYANGPSNRIYKMDPCTGNTIGYVVLSNDGSNDWGLYIDKNGKFYATQPTGKIYVFTPVAADFTSNTVFNPLIDLGANPTYGGLSPQYSGTGLQGIVTDNVGNMYVVEGNRDAGGTPSRLLKFSPTGSFLGAGPVDNLNNGAGWCQMTGIIYSENSGKLYTTSLDPGEDCVFIWNTNLTPVGSAIGPVPTLSGQCKAIGILSECCPQSETIVKSVCGVSTGDRISLSELLECEGIVCEGQWAAVAGNTNLTFNECDLTVTVGPLPACGSFTITNNGLTGTQCLPYNITLEVSYLASITAQVISGNQTVCPTDDPAGFTVTTNASTSPPGATITYQWQRSTTSATAGYSNIPAAQSAIYDSGPVSQTTYFRVIASIDGCTGGTCRDTSNVVVLTQNTNCCVNPTATANSVSPTCLGGSAQSNGSITINGFTIGQRYRYSTGATFNSGTAIPASITAIPATGIIVNNLTNTTQQYTVRIYDATDNTCFVDRTVSITAVVCGTCNCKEYIYLNEPDIGAVLKFEVSSNLPLTEVIGANGGTPPNQHWYPGLGISELPSPHGLGTDLNGNLYIGATGGNSQIRKFNCDGVISPASPTTINNPGTHQNLFSIGNTLYVNTNGGPTAYNTCTGMALGQVCLNESAGDNLWGLSYNEVTERVYITKRAPGTHRVWVLTKAQLEAGIAANGAICYDPILVQTASPTINPGESFIPSVTGGGMFGITSDNAGNFYVVQSAVDGGIGSVILKYNANGQFMAQTPVSLVGSVPIGSYAFSIGIVWSESTNRLYLSNFTDDAAVDCISVFDANTMTYLGVGAPNPNLPINNQSKAIAILKECCPVNLPSTFSKEVCGAVGTRFYLNQEAFDDCDGIVCGSSWTPVGTLTNMTFDACDNSVVVTGPGCGTFTLNIGAVSSTGCAAQSSTFTICNTLPSALVAAGPAGTCNGPTPNNNTSINVSSIMNANRIGISTGATYSGPTYSGAGIITGSSETFSNLMHNTQYTIRIFNGSDVCYVDYVVTTPTIQCCNISAIVPINLECINNGTPTLITDNRIRFSANVTNSNTSLSTYNVTINGGTTITPNTNVPYGVTQFTLGAGTAGGGATFTVTVTDSATPGCTQTFQIVDPGTCNPATPECPPVKCGTAAIQVNGN